MRRYLFVLFLFLIAVSCKQKPIEPSSIQSKFSFPPNKMWAHRVNTLEKLEKKHCLFEGMEIDIIYSNHIKNFYVAHDDKDTLRGILLETWITHIPNPEKNWYWLDMKNLKNLKNIEEVVSLLVDILNKYDIFHKTICESKDVNSLALLKKSGLAISYWIDSNIAFRKVTGNRLWKKRIERKIKYLQPNALSSFDWMSPLLDSSFPNEAILYWYFTEKETPEDVEFLKKLCQTPNVKVVLVDYDKPITY
jgi:hypothetical protein